MIVGHGSLLSAKGIDDADRIEPIMLELYGYDLTETTTPAFSDWLSAWLAIPTHRATIVMKVCTMIALETIVRLADGSPSQVVRVAFAQVDENNRPTASVLHWDCRQIRAVNGMVAFELTRPNQFNGSPGIVLADLIELSKEELISIKQKEFGPEEAPAAAHAQLSQL
ncbi:hypothetical protein MPSEU_000930100 [Mayamaea pseudoterrestris]|nr:hypothetical protein MPSEU_000930100 [Mayamaea pseudoterrestris]